MIVTFFQNYDGMTLKQKKTALSYAEKKLYFFPKQTYYPTYLFMRGSMDHMDLYDFAHCGFAQLRMIAAGDAKEEGTAVDSPAFLVSSRFLRTHTSGPLVLRTCQVKIIFT